MSARPIQITFRGLAHSEALEQEIHERVEWLEQFYSQITGCRVLVELPHRHRRRARQFHVSVELAVPGHPPIVVSHEPSRHATLKDEEKAAHHKESEIANVHRYARVAIHEAFDAARRRLQDFAREQRGAVKAHERLAG
jgi:ribosome-associated translation inhibitor RaiA